MDPQQRAELLNRITRLEIMGKHEDAMLMLRPLLDTPQPGPYVVDAYAVLSRHCGEQQQALQLVEDMLQRFSMEPALLARLHYRAGDLYDGMQEYDPAFSHYRAANDALPVRFDEHLYAQFIHVQRQFFTRDRMAGLARADLHSEVPVFIVGMPRTGTTLTESILDRHSRVYGAGELTAINDMVAALSLKQRWSLDTVYPACLASLDSHQLDELAAEYLLKAGENAPGAGHVVDKMPSNCGHLGFMEMILPGSRVIHCRRDPLDTCLSCYFQNFGNGHQYSRSLEALAKMYRIYLDMVEMWVGVTSLPVYELRYENLVADQERFSRELVGFCGLEWEDSCLAFNESVRFVKTCSYDQVRKPMYTSSVGRWKNYQKHIGVLLDRLDDLAERYDSGR